MSSKVWNSIIELKNNDDMKVGVANTLDDNDLETIIATIDFFGGNYRQDIWDLKAARYRVFDWLAMRIQGRDNGDAGDRTATQVLAYSFIKSNGVTSKFIQDLRETDYDIDESYKQLDLDAA